MNLLQDLTKNYVEGVGTTPYAAPFRLGAGQSGEMPSPIFRPGRKKSAELLTEPEYTSPKGNAPQRHDFKKLLAAAQKLEEKQKEEVKSTKEQLYVDNPEGMAQAGHHRLSLHAFAFRNLGLKDSHKKRIYDSRYIEQEYKAISQALGEQKKALVPKKKTYDVQNPTEPIFSMSKAIGAASKEELEEGFYLEAITPHEPEQQPLIELSSGLTQGIERAKFLIKPAAKASLDKFSQRFEHEQFNEVPLEPFAYSDLLLKHKLVKKLEKSGRKIGQFVFEYKHSMDWPEPHLHRVREGTSLNSKIKGKPFASLATEAHRNLPEEVDRDSNSASPVTRLKSNVKKMMAVNKMTESYTQLQEAQKQKQSSGLLTSKLTKPGEGSDGLFQQVVKTAKNIYYNNQSVSNIKNVKSGNFEQLPFADEFKKKFSAMEQQVLLNARNTQQKISLNLKKSKMERKLAQEVADRPGSPQKNAVVSRVFQRNKSEGGSLFEKSTGGRVGMGAGDFQKDFRVKTDNLGTEQSTVAASQSTNRLHSDKARIMMRGVQTATEGKLANKASRFRFIASEESENGNHLQLKDAATESSATLLTAPSLMEKGLPSRSQIGTSDRGLLSKPAFSNRYLGNRSNSHVNLSKIPEFQTVEERSVKEQKKFRATFSNSTKQAWHNKSKSAMKAKVPLETQRSVDDATSVGSVSRDVRSPPPHYSNLQNLQVTGDADNVRQTQPKKVKLSLAKLNTADLATGSPDSRRASLSAEHTFKSARVFRPPIVDQDKKARQAQLREFTRDVEQAGAFNKMLNQNYQTYSRQYMARNFPKELDYEWIFREYATEAEPQAVMDKAHKIYMMASPAKRKQILRKCTRGVTVNPGAVRMPPDAPYVQYQRLEV